MRPFCKYQKMLLPNLEIVLWKFSGSIPADKRGIQLFYRWFNLSKL